MVGYCLILVVLGLYRCNVLKDRNANTDKKVVAVSMILIVAFFFVGSPVLDYSIFALLFSPFLVKDLILNERCLILACKGRFVF